MSFLAHALQLASKGFHVFPLIPDSKLPLIEDFPNQATRDPLKIKSWWLDPVMEMEQPFNIGVSTTRFGEGEGLLVVDVDNKGTKKGDDELFRLELEGKEFPDTLVQRTPTGGRHLIYRVPEAVKQGSDVFGRGLDVRSRGGYIVGAGSRVEAGIYTAGGGHISDAPDWARASCGRSVERERPQSQVDGRVDNASAQARACHYLSHESPLALEGESGDQTTFKVACKVKDFGVSLEDCLTLMDNLWNPRCSPPWSYDELQTKVQNAYRYGAEPVGSSAPETQFSPVTPFGTDQPAECEKDHPFKELNKEYAFILAGGGSHILWETVDHKGVPKLEHVNIPSFHQKLAAHTMYLGDGKSRPISELWMKSVERRSYDGICFMPGRQAPEKFYNLWRGFAVEPSHEREHPSVSMFLGHALHNVCGGDEKLWQWLIGYFAHMIQRPWEKPLVALVFKGLKGTGKNALVDRVGHLLGGHYLLTSNRRYLVGNFNGHLENLLLFALDEAFWSGDKQAEGILKDLITGKTHVVEHKGKETYTVENCTRVVIIGNEDWLVPATQDERRFAVFNVGDGRKQDRAFFQAMREGMEQGGYSVLLRYLLDFDLSLVDVNAAPATQGLLDQKISSLDPFHQWWLECLTEGFIVSSDFGGQWPRAVDKDTIRSAFRRHVRDRNIRSRIPEDRSFGRLLKLCFPTIKSGQRREGDNRVNTYILPSLTEARADWDEFIGHGSVWPD